VVEYRAVVEVPGTVELEAGQRLVEAMDRLKAVAIVHMAAVPTWADDIAAETVVHTDSVEAAGSDRGTAGTKAYPSPDSCRSMLAEEVACSVEAPRTHRWAHC
jgi:hypothetical protein